MTDVEQDEPFYQPKDAIAVATTSGLVTGSAGLLFAAAQNTVAKQNVGALGIFTKFGGTTATLGTIAVHQNIISND